MSYRASIIKSIQYGTVALGNVTSATATITAVTVANSVVIPIGCSAPGGAAGFHIIQYNLTLTNSTTVTAARNTSNSTPYPVLFCVVEYYGNVLNSATQDFSVTLAATVATGTATVTAVSTTKSMLILRGWDYDTNNLDPGFSFSSLTQTNSTTITVTRSGTTGQLITKGTVVEFK